MTSDQPSSGEELTDIPLQQEIELVGDLVVAASQSSGPLSQDEIDRILGVPSPGSGGSSGPQSGRGWRRGVAIA